MSSYVIGQLNINDPGGYQSYLDGFQPRFDRHGGEPLASSKQDTEVLEGEWSLPRTVILRFPSQEDAPEWYEDPEYQALADIRRRTAETNLVVIDGIS